VAEGNEDEIEDEEKFDSAQEELGSEAGDGAEERIEVQGSVRDGALGLVTEKVGVADVFLKGEALSVSEK